MSFSHGARFGGNNHLLAACVSCMFLLTAAGMNATAFQTCEDLACQNSNVCQSSLVNDTHSGHAYCQCRGGWAGLRCELELFISAQSVASHTVVMELGGRLPDKDGHSSRTSDGLFVSEATVALWNFNASDQCLLLQQNMAKGNVIILEGLSRRQQYLVCIANGFVDSCLFFQEPLSFSKLSTCVYFETKLFDVGPFDIGCVIVPSTVLLFVIIVVLFLRYHRRSLVVQLCLNKLCCRSCYCLRKRIQRRQCLTYRHRDVSGDMLMPADVSADLESMSEAHTRTTGDSICRRTHSSTGSTTSRRSACSLDLDGSMSVAGSLEHNTFLYENQSLIPPLYSPQDHRVMTLTFIDDEFVPIETEQTAPSSSDTFFSKPYPNHGIHERASKGSVITASSTDCTFIKDSFFTAGSVIQNFTAANPIPDSILLKETPGTRQYNGPVKQQLLVHPYFHRPYDRRSVVHYPHHSSHIHGHFSRNEHGVRFREPNSSTQRQRPLSLPLTRLYQDSAAREESKYSRCEIYCFKSPRQSSLITTRDKVNLLPAWPTNDDNFQNNILSSSFNANSVRPRNVCLNKALGKDAKDTNGHVDMPVSGLDDVDGECTSNTLPRSKKPKFAPFAARHSIEDSLFISSFRAQKKPPFAASPKRPTWLNIANPIPKPSSLSFAQTTKSGSADNSISTDSKSQSKHCKSLISHFEHNLSFFRLSKSHHTTDEEKEYQDLLSPLAAERKKASKKARHSDNHKTHSTNKLTSSSSTIGLPVFEGHPSDHILPPFATDNDDDENDVRDNPTGDETADEISFTSQTSKNGGSVISSFEDNDTNLVTPFDTDNSSDDDDDTYKDIQSLTGSADTLQDLELEQSLTGAEGASQHELSGLLKDTEPAGQNVLESDRLLV